MGIDHFFFSPEMWSDAIGGFFGHVKKQVTKPGGYTTAEIVADLGVS